MSNLRKIVSLIIAGGLSLFAVEASADTFNFGVGGRPLICVPRQDISVYDQPLVRPNLFLGAAKAPTEVVLAYFDSSDVKKAISNFKINRSYRYNDPPNSISVDVSLIDDEYKRSSLGRAAGADADTIWNKTARCRQPVIAKVPASSAYLAKCDRNNFWHILFDRQPGYGKQPNDIYSHVLAECTHTSIDFGPHKGAELENCTRRIIVDNFRIDYQFQIENAAVIPEMDALMTAKVNSWKKNCRQND